MAPLSDGRVLHFGRTSTGSSRSSRAYLLKNTGERSLSRGLTNNRLSRDCVVNLVAPGKWCMKIERHTFDSICYSGFKKKSEKLYSEQKYNIFKSENKTQLKLSEKMFTLTFKNNPIETIRVAATFHFRNSLTFSWQIFSIIFKDKNFKLVTFLI